MLTLDKFEKKHKELFDLGVCHIDRGLLYTTITIDRYVHVDGQKYGTFLCDASKLKSAQADVRKMGYTNVGIGTYEKKLPIGIFTDKNN